ncbi:16S rRNA (guanine(527)-N(7))-methyltransferase RsmG [Pontivivens ytuae]|uniref:Ribosomal RNA small subunit methyltransferase G n=1 Tax=Pontivivens ytuae TaxID=2789856 RepID=A0A7S9LV84_9RHOB|nr:16S rRNA (guanine(527)-N(7))-methyltransferase RsmG [Pontivivens ytuae]QPH55884.1 16S rRNA (guanine(527)-N(7))-methyltransferase RsmG [Pontivivens ytuae]
MSDALRDVSRETADQLKIYAELLRKWNPRINLVSRTTLDDLKRRHFEDSLQLVKLAPASGHWVDLGSGGGFPGLVIAIAAPEYQITLVESDQRKCLFLREVARTLSLNVDVLNERIEAAQPLQADILSARALASLPDLLAFAERHAYSKATLLFPKGRTADQELTVARESWTFDVDRIPSQTDPASSILKITGARRVGHQPET